jgi:hypothetical protein
MSKRRKGEGVPRSLILRLLDGERGPWPKYEKFPPPAIQEEAARELRRLEDEVTRHLLFLESKKLLVEFVTWANKVERQV